MGSAGRPVLGDRRRQPLPDRAAWYLDHMRTSSAGATGSSLHRLRRTASDADGSWHSMVEHEIPRRLDTVNRMADEAGYPALVFRHPAPSDAGQGGALPSLSGDGKTKARATSTGVPPELAEPVSTGVQPHPPP